MFTTRELSIPGFCGPCGNVDRGGDINSSWTCGRAAGIYQARSTAEYINTQERRISLCQYDNVRRSLTAWVAVADTRLAREVSYLEERECTCRTPYPSPVFDLRTI